MIAWVAVAMAEDAGSVRHHLAQARQFAKNHWYADAALEIEAALALPGGSADFDVNWLGAQVYYELVDIDRALPCAQRAGAYAPTDQAREQADTFHAFLRDTFGWIEIRAPHDGMVSRLQLESTSIVFDADLKRLINKVSLDLREKTSLPARVALPAGTYLVNGAEVVVVAGQTVPLRLEMDQLGARGIAALQVTRFEVSAGMNVMFGERVANLDPGGAMELALTQPVGPVLVGFLGTYDLRTYLAGLNQQTSSPWSFGGGVRVGYELVIGGPLAVRPSVGARVGYVPGIGLACDDVDGSVACVPPDGGEHALELYAVGRSVAPFGELTVEYREAGRTTALGVGVKAVVEQHVGRVASPGEATLYGDPDATLLPYTAEPAAWSATGVRLLANLSLAF